MNSRCRAEATALVYLDNRIIIIISLFNVDKKKKEKSKNTVKIIKFTIYKTT